MLYHYHRYNHRYRSELSVTTDNMENMSEGANWIPRIGGFVLYFYGGDPPKFAEEPLKIYMVRPTEPQQQYRFDLQLIEGTYLTLRGKPLDAYCMNLK